MSSKSSAKKTGMGIDPLAGGLFDKTEASPSESGEPQRSLKSTPKKRESQNLEPRINNLENRKQKISNEFLKDIDGSNKESIGLQVTTEINDWLDYIVKDSRRKKGRKLPKQVLIQAGIELLRAAPIEWSEIGDIEELRNKLSEVAALLNH
ncbi:hypothetical protein [Leptolyngbya sp. GGD]|uniref:hypothetical protein n=1 Tax=Leptolyngbya sp. GGD TaxID=2997907 RepID=UPI00227D629B|nr:hypothetical protein [Leptolyngbya sp. GGD]MCY6494555.1 hypothetical protein [Leptolyngbya sp. GGD]